MRSAIALVFFVLLGVLSRSAGAAVKPGASDGGFYGIVQAVDMANKTFTIKSNGRLCVFHYNDETKISRQGSFVKWATVQPGEGASVLMRIGEGGVGVALEVRFIKDRGLADKMALFVARTPKGETISGVAVTNLIAYEPSPHSSAGLAGYGIRERFGSRSGVFHLTVRPDGSVAEVTAAKSMNDDKMNQWAAAWLRRWKFRPNSVTEVQVPAAFSWSSTY